MQYIKNRWYKPLLLLGILSILWFPELKAQFDATTAIPFDAAARTGTLENGMQYYIRQNAKPENYAELRLVLNAGSLMETDAQQGLAHFVEHMCFNGTADFPANSLINYLEKIGTKFGPHLNAYTSFDETVYMLRVPTDDEEKFQTGLQILENWAHKVSFSEEEIDKERGVVIEEWRSRLGASNRINQVVYPKLYYQSRYAKRLPIGKVPILESFPHDTLRTFYQTWYRPDLMAIIAVGDFDLDQTEKLISAKFGAIPKPATPLERPIYDVPLHEETIIALAADPEATSNQIEIVYKHERKARKNLGDYRRYMIERLATSMLNQRLDELTQQENPPFTYAGGGYYRMALTKDQYANFAIVPEQGFLTGMEELLLESRRAAIFGFTATELERTKKSMLAGIEKSYNERDKTPSARLVSRYISHFLRDNPAPSTAQIFELYQAIMPSINLAEVNTRFQELMASKSRVIIISGTEKEGNPLPSEEEIRKILASVNEAEITAYEDQTADGPLMTTLPTPGSIVSSQELPEIEATELILSNGIKVMLKPTDFQNDEISFQAFGLGGTSVFDAEESILAENATPIIASSGVGPFNNIQLDKYLSDKVVDVSPYVSELYQGFSGSCAPKDLETMFQLIHLYASAPRKDETAFKSYISKNQSYYANLLSSPEYWFINEMLKTIYQGDPRRFFIPDAGVWEKLNLDQLYSMYQQIFGDAGDLHFVFVGNFDIETIKPLLSQYLGSLPATSEPATWQDPNIPQRYGAYEKVFRKGSEPKSQNRMVFAQPYQWGTRANLEMSATVQVLRIMLREVLREAKGGVYGVNVSQRTFQFPKESYSINISFTCSPENSQELRDATIATIKKLQKEGPSAENLNKIKEMRRKDLGINLESNRFWLNYLNGSYQQKTDPLRIQGATTRIEDLSAKKIKKAARKYFDFDHLAVFILLPEEENMDR